MIETIFLSFSQIWTNVSAWFVELMSGVAFIDYLMAVLVAMLAYRFLLRPMLKGGLGSDKARKKELKE